MLVLAAVGTVDVAHAYDPRVTRDDLKAAKAQRTTGDGWVLNGRLWNCSGGGYCTIVS
jgi:hypothetical protein